MRHLTAYAAIVLLLCTGGAAYAQKQPAAKPSLRKEACRVAASYRHDTGSYTQGLFFYNGKMYESAGQYGESSIRIVDYTTGRVLRRRNFERNWFIEGSCVCGGRLYILSWKENTCFVCNPETLEDVGKLRYAGEGWGLTTDGENLIMSDGSAVITFRDPANFAVRKSVKVTLEGKPLNLLNELEYINGEIWANVYCTDMIVRIDPQNGRVKSVIDCRGLLPEALKRPSTDVLNGIAYNPEDGSVYLTGKFWPKIYKISNK